jgi:hypothetical protein
MDSSAIRRRATVTCGCAVLAVTLGAAVTGGYGIFGLGAYPITRSSVQSPYHHGCELPHCFSITMSASSLSGFAGVLTALTFSAIVFLLGRDQHGRSELQSTIILFTAAFVSLILATYLYTDAAAEEAASFRAAAVSFAASIPLGIAILQLFLGIVHMVRQHAASPFLVRVASWFIGPAVFYFLMATAVNAWGLEITASAEWHSSLAHGIEVLLAIWIFAAFLPWSLPRYPTIAVWATFSLGAVAVATFFVGYWGEKAPSAAVPPGAYFGAMVVLLLLGIGYCGLLKQAIERTPPPPASGSSSTGSLSHTFRRWPLG